MSLALSKQKKIHKYLSFWNWNGTLDNANINILVLNKMLLQISGRIDILNEVIMNWNL